MKASAIRHRSFQAASGGSELSDPVRRFVLLFA
jgi:hypothetical protein